MEQQQAVASTLRYDDEMLREPTRYHLVLVVGPDEVKLSSVLSEAAAQREYPVLDMGRKLSETLVAVPEARRARIAAAADPGTLSRFQVGVADNFSFGGIQKYVDTEGFRISQDEAFAAIMPTVKKTPEYAKIMKRYGAAMKRLDEAADPSKVDAITYRDAYQGRIQLDGLCDLLAPKYVVPPGEERCVNVVFIASGYLRSELVTIVHLIPLGSGFGVTDFVIGDTQGE